MMEKYMKNLIGAVSVAAVLILMAGCGGSNSVPPPPVQTVAFSSTPTVSAVEGQSYTYTLAATASDSSAVTYQLTTGPAGAAITGNSLSWTPSTAQSRTSNSFTVTAAAGTATAHQTWTVTPLGTIHGSQINNFLASSGSVVEPVDASQLAISAAVPDGTGGFNSIAATGLVDGTFSAPSVPGGSYWLQVQGLPQVWTPSSTVDAGQNVLGRPDVSYPSQPTTLDLDFNGLLAWQSPDLIVLYVPNTGYWSNNNFSLNTGDTTLSVAIPWTQALFTSAEGDQAYVTQLSTTSTAASGYSVQVAAASQGPLEIDLGDGDPSADLSGTLQAIPLSYTVRGNIKGSAFAALETAINPNSVPDSSYFDVEVQPTGAASGQIGSPPDLVFYDGTSKPIRTDVDLGDIHFGNPYPTAWAQFLDYTHYVRVDYTAPGATTSTSLYAYVEVQSTTMPNASSPITPVISPVTAPKVGTGNFFGNLTSVGTTPTISWSAPATGTPTGYTLDVLQLSNDSGDSGTNLLGTLYTSTTSVQLPAGLLASGNSYIFIITAVNEPGVDYTSAPFKHKFPRAVAQSLSGIIAP